jgi:hypothetical protein
MICKQQANHSPLQAPQKQLSIPDIHRADVSVKNAWLHYLHWDL